MPKFQITYYKTFNIFFIVGLIFLLLNLNSSYFFIDKLQVTIIYILNLLPFFYYLKSHDNEKILPLFHMALIFIFLSYTLTFFIRDLEFETLYIPGQTSIMMEQKIPLLRHTRNILLIGLLFLNLGYFFSFLFFKKRRKGFDFMDFKGEGFIIFTGFLIFTLFILCFLILKLDNLIPGFSQLKYPMIYSSAILIFLGILNKKNNIFVNFLYILPIIFIFYYHISNGIYGFPFKLITILFVLFIFIKKRVPIYFLTLSVIFFLILHSLKYDIRFINKFQGPQFDRKVLLMDKIKYRFSNKENKIDSLTNNPIQAGWEIKRTVQRLAHGYHSLLIINVNHKPIQKNKEPAKHLNGYTYKLLLTKLIPRIFWENKPIDNLANSMGKYYNYITPNDFKTSWNFPVLNESYSNFGFKGVIIVMFLVGAIFRYLSFNFFISKKNNFEFIIAFSLVLPLWFLESHLSLLIGAIIQQYLLLFLGFYLYLRVLKLFNYNSK